MLPVVHLLDYAGAVVSRGIPQCDDDHNLVRLRSFRLLSLRRN
jgi:hypothetical protein